jgi:hypothetical protein
MANVNTNSLSEEGISLILQKKHPDSTNTFSETDASK